MGTSVVGISVDGAVVGYSDRELIKVMVKIPEH